MVSRSHRSLSCNYVTHGCLRNECTPNRALFNGPSWLFITIELIRAVTAVAHSAQFSAAIIELSDRSLVGPALASQMGVGFAITIFVISLLPVLAEHMDSWRWGFVILVPGPFLGAL